MAKKLVCVMLHEYEIDEAQKKAITKLCNEYNYEVVFSIGEEAYKEVEDAEIIYGYEASLIPKAKDLKWFASTWAGVGPYLVDGLLKEDTLLSNSSGCFGVTIGEHMIEVLLIMMRRYNEYRDIVLNKGWRNDFKIDTIYDSKIMVLGTGDIGTAFAYRAKGFNPSKIIGINKSGIKKDDIYDEVYPISELDKHLKEVNVIAMAMPGTNDTINILSKERIEKLNPDTYIINVGRGNAIDEEALMNALNNDKIKGAALDVFVVEPIPEDSPLHTTKNLVITPHCSGQMGAKVTRDLHFKNFIIDLERYFNNELPLHLVDKNKGY